jgi:hypothetical protein
MFSTLYMTTRARNYINQVQFKVWFLTTTFQALLVASPVPKSSTFSI